MSNNDKHATDVLNQLKSGTILIKRKSDGKKYSRRFYLHEDEDYFSYDKSRKLFRQPQTYHIKDIDEVRCGFRGGTFDRLVQNGLIKPADESRALSVMYDNHRKELHLMAPDESTRDSWAQGLQQLLEKHSQKSQRHLIKEENWILKHFRSADTDESNSLTKRECNRLLIKTFNVKIPDKMFEQLFQKADKSSEGLLSQEEFVGFFNLLTQRKDLYEIMQKYTKNGHSQSIDTISMNISEVLFFLQTAQHQSVVVNEKIDDSQGNNRYVYVAEADQVKKLIDEYEMDDELREKGLLGLDGFRNMLLSSDFDIIKPLSCRQIHQDMTRSLCDYYINTSHNTYLFYGQLSGESNPEAYTRALRTGCRAVELDCYDGNDGKPIVKHAYTLVKACTFESIIRCMEPNLFKTSPYPVILNIENHCSPEQQKEMARILKDILGDRLVTKLMFKKNTTLLPSPEDLKYKVFVRNVQPELAQLFVYLQNVPFKEYDYAETHYSSFHSSSLAENRFETVAREDPLSLVLQTTWRILRTYPGGLRQDSSNANPVAAWNYGIQMAALNFQNDDDMMPLCYGKFLDNGGCGYILKPEYLTNARETKYNPMNPDLNVDYPQLLTIRVISAQFLSRSNTAATSDVPDPYVTMSIHGLPGDQQIQKTKVIENNGLDPIWNETFSFRVKYPQMALVCFTVYDSDAFSRDDKLAVFCLPLTMMQKGYRHIHLRANNNDPTYSTLFVHVNIEDISDNIISIRC